MACIWWALCFLHQFPPFPDSTDFSSAIWRGSIPMQCNYGWKVGLSGKRSSNWVRDAETCWMMFDHGDEVSGSEKADVEQWWWGGGDYFVVSNLSCCPAQLHSAALTLRSQARSHFSVPLRNGENSWPSASMSSQVWMNPTNIAILPTFTPSTHIRTVCIRPHVLVDFLFVILVLITVALFPH